LRAAMALGGVMGDPVEVERALAHEFTDSGGWARRSEASRVPRPVTRPAILRWSLAPVPWVDDEGSAWPSAGADALTSVRQPTGTDAQPARVAEEPYRNWVQLALIERQGTLPSRYPRKPGRQVTLMSGRWRRSA
jgi:hypothetical protein